MDPRGGERQWVFLRPQGARHEPKKIDFSTEKKGGKRGTAFCITKTSGRGGGNLLVFFLRLGRGEITVFYEGKKKKRGGIIYP